MGAAQRQLPLQQEAGDEEVEREKPADNLPARQRRKSNHGQARVVRPEDISNREFLVPNEFRMMAAVFPLAMIVPALAQLSLPPLLSVALVILASAIALATPKFVAFERAEGRPLHLRILADVLSVGVAMAAYGFAMGWWWDSDPAATRAIFGSVICVSTVVAILHGSHLRSLFPSLLACWSMIVLLDGRLSSFLLFANAIVIGFIFGIRQIAREKDLRVIELEKAREQMRAESILTDYEDTGQGWFWETDRNGRLTYISAPAARAIGHDDRRLVGHSITSLFNLKDAGQDNERTLTFHLSARSAFQELPVRAASDEERWWSVSGRPIYDEFDNFMGFRGSGTDLTEKKRSQDKASRLALFDSLTGLANRLQISQDLEKILDAPQEQGRICSVFLLDLDRFKQVNDTLGHPAGDALLKQVAKRLEVTIGELGRVGRLGGDEFQVIIPGRVEQQRLAYLANEVIHQLSQPYSIDGHQVIIGASIGIAVAPVNGDTSEDLVRNADLALYAAKDAGRGRFHFYSANLHDQAQERRELEHDLREALVEGNLELHYQPFVSLSKQQITGFESLMRWQHPKHGWVSPQKFVSVAEDSGLIEAMGEWAIRTVCAQLAVWPEEIRVAVNVSPLQFANPNLPKVVANAITQAGIDPERLELEITESVFLNDDDATDAMFASLKNIGVRLALDDFGTGYSALGYLKKAPFDKIKIDQSFVRGATQPGSRNMAIIRSITGLADSLGMDTTAEGVETLDELELVTDCGCSHVQGYIYEKAIDAESASARLDQGLDIVASGPKSARPPRYKMFRKVVLDHGGQFYNGVVRNISEKGLMIEGLWNVPAGTTFTIHLSEEMHISATSRWCEEDRMGLQLAEPIEIEPDGSIPAISSAAAADIGPRPSGIRKAG